MKYIQLTHGQVALVDDEDYEYLRRWKWYAKRGHATWYAQRTAYLDGKRLGTILMHRLIGKCPPTLEMDHINHDGLDNRKINLRICTHRENSWNSIRRAHKTSRYIGVSWHKSHNRWQARIREGGKQIHLGDFGLEEEAAHVYQKRATTSRGEFVHDLVI